MRVGARTPSRRIAAACAALAGALLASGCGSSASVSSAVLSGPLDRAADVTAQAGSASTAITIEVGAGGEPVLTMNGSGRFNLRSAEGEMTVEANAPSSSGLGSGSFTMTELTKLPSTYIRTPLFEGKLPGGAQWLKVDSGGLLEHKLGLDLEGASQSNPAEFLSYLRATGAGVSLVGHESVRGVPTTRYRAALDLEKAVERLPSNDRAQLRAAFAKLRALIGSDEVPVEAWVDSANLVRRIAMRYPLSVENQHITLAMSIEYFDFGPVRTIAAPPANEVYEATQAQLEGAFAGSSE